MAHSVALGRREYKDDNVPKAVTRRRMMAIVVVILIAAALKLSAPVTLPLAFAVFLIALFWPLQRSLQKKIGSGGALLVTLLVFLLTVAAFGAALWYSSTIIADKAPQYEHQYHQYEAQARQWSNAHGFTLPGGSSETTSQVNGSSQANDVIIRLSKNVFSFVGGFVLVVAFLALGLLEVCDFRYKMNKVTNGHKEMWIDSVHNVCKDFQRYIIVRTAVGLITGGLVWLLSWMIGLDFAFIWGLLNFILNYVPTLGSILAVIPPVVFALFQGGLTKALLALLIVGGVQLLMGNFVDPKLQGKYLSLSPFVVLFSVVLWGWIWGVPGAFIGIPIMIALVIACNQFDSTRWIATMLANVPKEERREASA